MPAASVYALCEGFGQAGFKSNQGIGVTETLADARSLFLTPNSTVVYVWFCADLKDGPMVVQVPPGVLGMIDDAYFRYITDLGFPGPDQGKGGKYLLVPPDYTGALPSEGYFVNKSRTYSNLFIIRSFVQNGDVAAAVKNVKDNARMYPLSAAANPPAQKFVNISGLQFNTVHANDFHFFNELNAVVQHEPADFIEPETVGVFAAIGIKKGKPFAPDARMKAILTDSMAVGNATARANLFTPRDPRLKIFPDRQWLTTFIGGSYDVRGWRAPGYMDARAMFHYYATGVTPAMTAAKPGTGSVYAIGARDSQGRYFDGAKTYKVTLPRAGPRRPVLVVHDLRQPDALDARNRSGNRGPRQHVCPTLRRTPTARSRCGSPESARRTGRQLGPDHAGKGWNTLLRLYGPTEPWFDKTWKPGDFELVN